MLHKLGSWVWIGGGALAAIAGMVNAIGFLGYSHQAVTHLSGTASLLGVALHHLDASAVLHLGAVCLSFLLGAVLSGFIIRRQTLRLGRRYGAALALEGGQTYGVRPMFVDFITIPNRADAEDVLQHGFAKVPRRHHHPPRRRAVGQRIRSRKDSNLCNPWILVSSV